MQYNRSLDFIISAAVKLSQGKHELAAKLMVKASREPSFAKAVQILEASNQRAFQADAARIEARRQVRAAEDADDAELNDLVGDLDDLDNEVTAGEAAPEKHPAVDEGVPTEMLEKQARGKDPVAANSRFVRALATANARR
jgi:hypothetical protein